MNLRQWLRLRAECHREHVTEASLARLVFRAGVSLPPGACEFVWNPVNRTIAAAFQCESAKEFDHYVKAFKAISARTAAEKP